MQKGVSYRRRPRSRIFRWAGISESLPESCRDTEVSACPAGIMVYRLIQAVSLILTWNGPFSITGRTITRPLTARGIPPEYEHVPPQPYLNDPFIRTLPWGEST